MICASGQSQTRAASTTDPVTANLPAQPIGPNDLVSISVYDAPELSRTVRVGSDGLIRLPMMREPIKAQGLMPSALEAAIADALREEQLIVDPFVTVTVAEYNSRPISVAGAVKEPLTFQAIGPTTLLEAITRAGGLSTEAGAEILVSRPQLGADGSKSELVERIPVKGLIDAADPKLNISLTGGEEIRVPEVGKVFVVGNVTKPGAYPIVDSTESSVLRMLAEAEGLQRFATKDAYIYRREANGEKNEIPVPLEKIMERKAPDVPLLANDILYVPDNKGRRITVGALEKLLIIGGGVSAALVYAGVR
ncbi:MAG TPA: polysaccharide biosynthesis/export family protein [Bryobacteraceae bacterium]|nr:polysaccharide biosynthesis/export family protein [Bryobacteraceae bacterium]